MSGLPGFERSIQLYEAGALSEASFMSLLIEQTTSENVCDLLQRLSPDRLKQLKKFVDAAPSEESDWKRFMLIELGCFDRSAMHEMTLERERISMRYRNGIESLRA